MCVPLLLSRTSLKKAGANLDFAKDEVELFGDNIPIVISKSGHYCISLTHQLNSDSHDIQRILFNSPFVAGNDTVNRKLVVKLHKQFAHPPPEKLNKLISDSGVSDRSIASVSAKCDVCRRFKRPPLRPAVGFPTASSFNEVVAMDLQGSLFSATLRHSRAFILNVS